MSLYALILAGGSGERFWPLSRKNRPKQLLNLFSGETLLAATLRRLDGLIPPEQILILTNADQEAGVRAIATQLPAENIVAEPAKRDTAAAIALGVGWVAARDHKATMIVLPADHLIEDQASFQRTLQVAASAAEATGELVTIGIQPTWACPGFGYLELGHEVDVNGQHTNPKTWTIARFREKPSVELAESFLQQGNFRWNAGMFIWTVPAIVSAFTRHASPLAHFIERLRTAPDWLGYVNEAFPELPKISIDYAIMEKAARVLMVESAFDWDDVGSWTAVAKYLAAAEGDNVANTPVQSLDSSNNIVYADKPLHVGLLGVRDLIIVKTEDALLVCSRAEAEKIKNLVAKLPAQLQ